MKVFKKIFAFVLMLLLMQGITAFAYTPIDSSKNCSLDISCSYGEKKLEGMEIELYKAAYVDENEEFVPTHEFAPYHQAMEMKNQDQYKKLAAALHASILQHKIPALASGKADKQGMLHFPQNTETLSPGLYLVVAASLQTEDFFIYSAEPFLVALPNRADTNEPWDYDVAVNAKLEEKPVETVERKVLKKWNDKGLESKRPAEIQVELYKNKELFETVTLNKDNNWSYKWDRLTAADDWSVTEKKLDGYKVQYSQEGITFIIENTPNTPPPPPPPNPPHIPQTGTTWQFVPILASGGLLFLILGVFISRRKHEEE